MYEITYEHTKSREDFMSKQQSCGVCLEKGRMTRKKIGVAKDSTHINKGKGLRSFELQATIHPVCKKHWNRKLILHKFRL